MSSHARNAAPPGASRKRKDREPSDPSRSQSAAKVEPPGPPAAKAVRAVPAKDNRLLAGLLAHEFLTQGTLLGRRWEAGRPEPRSASAKPWWRSAYAEVSYLLKADAAHIPGVVNPTQLARWLQM